jgi:hypothetical protein
MRIDTRACRECFLVPLTLAAMGCSDPSLLGISAEVDEQRPSSAELTSLATPRALAPLHSTVITGKDTEYLTLRRPSLGDLDGDGLDDFVIEGLVQSDNESGMRAFLFYGRTDFPAQLSAADADAVLEAGGVMVLSLGDINGDGLSDLALGDWSSTEIIFGSSTRLSGKRARFSDGVAWSPADHFSSNLSVWPIGDLDGDGMDELRVTMMSMTPGKERQEETITDYIVAGRKGGWPSGSFDPSWAVASLGDEPPAFEDDGATTVLQRLVLVGTGDFDGDGYRDLLTLGRWKTWVFYGGPAGLKGTLTPEQAAASLTWQVDPTASRADFATMIPIVLGDVDGDGTTDLGIPNHAELGIVYGTKQRWGGRVALEPELTIVRATTELADQNWWLPLANDIAYGQPLPEAVSAQMRVGAADLDGDAQPELIVHENNLPTVRNFEDVITSSMYVLTGPSQRATGRYVLSDSDLYKPAAVSGASAALDSGSVLDLGGDFDGDGSTDLIFGLMRDIGPMERRTIVQVVPGAPHAPD